MRSITAMQSNTIHQAQFWNRIARKYAADPIADLPGYEHSLRRTQALLNAQQDVLEVGCGTGTSALRLAGGTRSYLATDLSSEMIAIAREKLLAQPVPQLRFEVAQADASTQAGRDTPAKPAPPYDVVLAFNTLHLVPDLDRTLSRLRDLLKPGGLLISKTACVGEMNRLIPWLALPVARWMGKAPPVLVFKADHLLTAFERQGLRVDAVERHGTQGKDIRVFVTARRP